MARNQKKVENVSYCFLRNKLHYEVNKHARKKHVIRSSVRGGGLFTAIEWGMSGELVA